MSDQCLTMADLVELATLETGDARRSHLDRCPRCQGLATSYASFISPENIPAEADLVDAGRRLSAALAGEIAGGTGGKIVRPASFTRRFLGLRPLAAAAAVVVVALGLTLMRGGPQAPPLEPVLRGAGDTVAPFSCEIVAEPTGEYRLHWAAVAEAETYRVVVFGTGLAELATHEVGADTSFTLMTPLGAAFCQVVALRGGDEIGRSQPAYMSGR